MKETNDEKWADMHYSSLKVAYIEFILKDENNFGDDNLIKDEVLERFAISCPKSCSGNGVCYKSSS